MLSLMVEWGYLQGTAFILQFGFDINGKDKNGRTALSYAVQSHPRDCVELLELVLAQEGVDLEAADSEGRAPLDWAKINPQRWRSEWQEDTQNKKQQMVELLEKALEARGGMSDQAADSRDLAIEVAEKDENDLGLALELLDR